jgi:hypothetical protein
MIIAPDLLEVERKTGKDQPVTGGNGRMGKTIRRDQMFKRLEGWDR